MNYDSNDNVVDERMDEGHYNVQGNHGEEIGFVQPTYPQLPIENFSNVSLDWQYAMRRSMQEIVSGVYLGSYASATRCKLEEMKSAGLTHVVCVRQFLERNLIRPNHPDHFKYLVVELADSATENIISHFKLVQKFIDDCLAEGGKVLVHGNLGVSRSAALVIAYLMATFGISYDQAHHRVLMKRYCIEPNVGFKSQLVEYEAIYKAQHAFRHVPAGRITRGSLKRNFGLESDEENQQPHLPRKLDANRNGSELEDV